MHERKMSNFLLRTRRWYTKVPAELNRDEARIFVGAKIGYSVSFLVQLLTAAIFYELNEPVLTISSIIGTLLSIYCLFCLVTGQPGLGFIIINSQSLAGGVLATIYLGLTPCFFLLALIGLIYSTLGGWLSSRLQWMLILLSAGVFVGTLLYGVVFEPLKPLPPLWEFTFAAFNGSATVGMLIVVAVLYRKMANDVEGQLSAQFQQSESLLQNMIPPEVALRLKQNPKALAESHQNVTVLFADLVGFTKIAENSAPEAVVSLLNKVFSEFDDLVDELKLEKIKTIGDAYMVVAGLPSPREDHALVICQLALRMIRVTNSISTNNPTPLQIRVGIHSGPVVAGVIGQRKFAYDLWGDTVNIAARMESHGEPQRIQLSAKTAELLQGSIKLEQRGTIEIKGKGSMKTYYLVDEN